jgi:hypothetical protein
VLWKFLYLNDKTVMRVVQYGVGVFLGIHLFIDFLQLFETGFGVLLETTVRNTHPFHCGHWTN